MLLAFASALRLLILKKALTLVDLDVLPPTKRRRYDEAVL
jgi:hypothetical protein